MLAAVCILSSALVETWGAESGNNPAPQQSPKAPDSKKRQKKGVRKHAPNGPTRQEPPKPIPTPDQPKPTEGVDQPPPRPVPPPLEPFSSPQEVYFSVLEFQVEGNTLLPPEKIEQTLEPYKGFARKIEDIEKTRGALEKVYHDLGYPTVLVTVPEQSVETGTVRLLVVETKLGEVTVTGNRWFSTQRILEKVPSLRSGWLLYEPTLNKELDKLNANPDRQGSPVLKPGKHQGTVDLELKVTDRLPVHAKLSADNRGPITTPQDRLLAEAQYTNLWDREHILTVQTVQTPTDWGAVQTYGFSYAAPLPREQLLSLYFAKTKSNSVLAGTALPVGAGGDIGVAGNATVTGIRYTAPFPALGAFRHQATLGMDFKRLEPTTAQFPGGLGNAVVLSSIQYTPMSLSYSGYLQDKSGVSSGSAGIKGYIAGMIPGGDREDFGGNPNDPINQPGNRAGSTGTFYVVQGSLDRYQALPEAFSLTAHVDGQWASQPLIPAEEYFAGGLDTVRGYSQFEAIADNAVRTRLEGLSPSLGIALDRAVNPRLKLDIRLAAFYDAAFLWVQQPQPGQKDKFQLEGVGGGVRAALAPFNLKVHLDQGFALRDSTVTKKGDTFVHFAVEIGF